MTSLSLAFSLPAGEIEAFFSARAITERAQLYEDGSPGVTVAGADAAWRMSRFGRITLQEPVPHPWWPERALRSIPVIPLYFRESEDSDLNADYGALLRLLQLAPYASPMITSTVQGILGEPRPATVARPGLWVESLPVPDVAALFDHWLQLCGGFATVPDGATTSTVLDGTHTLHLRLEHEVEGLTYGSPIEGTPNGLPARLQKLLEVALHLGARPTFSPAAI